MKEIQHQTKRTHEPREIPNLVELQINSYEWFLKHGLRELFHSFSPITDFTGNLSLELVDYELGPEKYSVEECRYRDMTTYERPIKARVRLTQTEKEVIESEVYLGDLPMMTNKGTFVINGAERVVVSQLARSPGVYFRDSLDYSGRVIYFATIIPSPGAWIDIETGPTDAIEVHVAQTKKFPLTTLLRALSYFEQARPASAMVNAADSIGKTLAGDIANEDTGEIYFERGSIIDEKMIRKLHSVKHDIVEIEVEPVKCSTTVEILDLFCEREILSEINVDTVTGLRPTSDIVDPKNNDVIIAAGERISEERAKKVEKLNISSIEFYVVNKFIEATLQEDTTNSALDALIDIYKRIRPGDPATKDSSISLMISYFFDTRRYDLAKVGRYKLNKKLGMNMPEHVRSITCNDLIKIIYYLIGLSENGSLVSHWNPNNLAKRISELDAAVAEAEKTAGEGDLAIGGKVHAYKINLEFLKNVTKGTMFTETRLKGMRQLLNLIPNGIRLMSTSPADLYINENAMRLSSCALDDIDHLENKRVRSVGELLQDQLRMGFLRMEKVAKERMTSMDSENVIPQVVLSVKPISASIKSFFGSSQLSQFMDQTNPLAELTHKRRLSALGPGGLSRQSAKLEVRDVHHSHYGRICPIETPEGPNIGLIGSMAIHAKIDPYGFLKTPYMIVKNGKLTDEIIFLSADEESQEYIAPANTIYDAQTKEISATHLVVRHEHTYPQVPSNKVTFIEISPMQIMSVAASLIPFLENDDANRALMGSNMQRQAVPLLRGDAPIVRTGIEARAARDSGAVVVAKRGGIIRSSTADRIVIEAEDGTADEYTLINMLRSNQGTCITQKPIVKKGNRVRAGDVLADGPCTDEGELALGQNILVAFMPWNGYNYEDAILLSRRLVKDDVYSSIHIEKHETEARDTKLGPEEITRDIPNVGEEGLKDLDANGIIRVGAEVRPEDIVVGKVAPKGQGELTAEERLIIAIFGKKAEETRDVSLRIPHGEQGTIVDVKVFSRFKYRCTRCEAVFNFSKKPEKLSCERCDGELIREQGDELNAGVNQLVRVYIAQKRKIMEGDKMAGRHGNKGVISKILPEEDMPFLPDGTPVDIVLNPLGVPSRMNIGQILETHQGFAGRLLGCDFKNPIFQGANEEEILADLDILVWKLKINALRGYVKELGLDVKVASEKQVESIVRRILNALSSTPRSELVNAIKPLRHEYEVVIEQILETMQTLDAATLEILSLKVGGQAVVEDPMAIRETLGAKLDAVNDKFIAEITGTEIENPVNPDDIVMPFADTKPSGDFDYKALVDLIEEHVKQRVGYNPKTGKCAIFDGRSGAKFSQDVTIGYVYMLKLHHLVEDKIHARSTGPYSLVTQQPLGGKAQFGGQRFGEMEVWALEAYGAAYTLQEILTIKSDDVTGRVKTYESIVKGESIQEPGVPESFKILINELQSLCLKVSVEDEKDRVIDLKDTDDDDREGGSRRRSHALELRED